MSAIGTLLIALSVLVSAWLLPAAAVRGVLPLAEKSAMVVSNYRGRSVTVVNGIAWLTWGLGMAPIGVLIWAEPWRENPSVITAAGGLATPSLGLFACISAALAIATYALGFVDDVFDTGEAKGLRGHLGLLASGRVSTGLLKLIGIGLMAATASAAWVLGTMAWLGTFASVPMLFVRWFFGMVLIAASSNAMNLLDLRPGRALKAYSFASGIPLVYLVYRQTVVYRDPAPLHLAALALMVFGPVIAVWRLDLGERAMLGDAGSNPMGAFAAMMWIAFTPREAVIAAATFAVALNLLAEKISLSALIERVAVLRWLDRLGRLPEEAPPTAS